MEILRAFESAEQLDHLRDEACPSCLVAGTKTRAVVAMKIS
jgi:hypothetical protein